MGTGITFFVKPETQLILSLYSQRSGKSWDKILESLLYEYIGSHNNDAIPYLNQLVSEMKEIEQKIQELNNNRKNIKDQDSKEYYLLNSELSRYEFNLEKIKAQYEKRSKICRFEKPTV